MSVKEYNLYDMHTRLKSPSEYKKKTEKKLNVLFFCIYVII